MALSAVIENVAVGQSDIVRVRAYAIEPGRIMRVQGSEIVMGRSSIWKSRKGISAHRPVAGTLATQVKCNARIKSKRREPQ